MNFATFKRTTVPRKTANVVGVQGSVTKKNDNFTGGWSPDATVLPRGRVLCHRLRLDLDDETRVRQACDKQQRRGRRVLP
jgi:hypothetical protein